MKKLPLWLWGFLFVFGSLVGNMTMASAIHAADLQRTHQRAAELGAAIASVILSLIGVGLIVAHFLRRNRK